MGDDDQVVYTVRVEDAFISNITWRKHFCLLPQVSSATAKVIWLKYAYRGVVSLSIPAIGLLHSTEMWQTPEEHTGWILTQGVVY